MSQQVSYEQAKQAAEEGREDIKLPSFGKELFQGNLRLELIHPQPAVDAAKAEKGEAFLEKMRTYLAEHVDPLQIERDAKIPADVIEGLKGIGALGIKIPEEYGGLGLSQVYYNKALALAGTWHSALATLLSAHQSIGLPEPLRLYGSEEQKREWLPKLAKTHISAFLLTEPDVGSDPARMTSMAVPTEDGKGYLLNGQKLWATNGTVADVVVIMAVVPKSEGHKGGITALICPYKGVKGITVDYRNDFMGLRGIENSLTTFKDVYIPKENVIAGEGKGLKIALATLNTGRLSLPAIAVAACRYSVKIAREWGVERKQWGQSVGRHDEVAQKIAFIAGTAFGLEAMIDVSSRLADDKRNDIRIEAALAKLYGAELGWLAIDTMVQVRGGRGYETAESLLRRGEKPIPAEQMLRDMRINRIFEGSSEIMHLLIAREAVDQHLKVAGALLFGQMKPPDKAKEAAKVGAFYAKWFPSLAMGEGAKPGSYAEFGELAQHMRYAERAARKLARTTFYAMIKLSTKLEKKGATLGRIVDIGAELFAIASACVYAQTVAREHPERAESAAELADIFCRQARRRAEAKFESVFDNDDDDQYTVSKQLLEGRYLWFEEGILDPAENSPALTTQQPTQGPAEEPATSEA